MQITVKDIRHIHSKPDAAKKWHLVGLVDAEDQEYTTFDLAVADVGIGGVIEFNVEMKKGKANIAEGWKIVSKGTPEGEAPPGPGPGKPNGKPDMSKDDWVLKDRLELWSREANACYMGLPELLKVDHEFIDGGKQKEAYDAALEWANAHFTTKAPAPIAKATTETKAEKPATLDKDWEKLASGSETPEFKNPGDFLTRATKEFGMTALGICIGLGVKEIAEVTDFTAAWAKLKASKANAES